MAIRSCDRAIHVWQSQVRLLDLDSVNHSRETKTSFIRLRRFVSALEYIPPTTAHPTPLILSAGGDPTLQSFNLATGALIAQIPVSVFNASILAAPEASVLIDHGKKAQQKRNVAEGRNKRQGKDQNLKGKGKQAELVIEVEDGGDDDEEMHAVEEVEDVPVENSAIVPLRLGKMRYDGKLKGLAICKIVRIGDRDTGGVILIASGSVFSP